jgi:hypothetical protein
MFSSSPRLLLCQQDQAQYLPPMAFDCAKSKYSKKGADNDAAEDDAELEGGSGLMGGGSFKGEAALVTPWGMPRAAASGGLGAAWTSVVCCPGARGRGACSPGAWRGSAQQLLPAGLK